MRKDSKETINFSTIEGREVRMIQLIKAALWGEEPSTASREIFIKMKTQGLAVLVAPVLTKLNLPSDLYNDWKREILRQIAHYNFYLHEQSQIPITVPYAILKGSSAAQYYPHPEYRAMGDIDLITRREDYCSACDEMLRNGYTEYTISKDDGDFGRHRCFSKNGIEVEVHAFFALLNNASHAQYFDDLIISGINTTHLLPDMFNGLVLLEHIAQHLEAGLGLRQVIDWMMFVHKCLPDEKWLEFQKIVREIDFETFAITVTRMCEMYLGLPIHNWCSGADEHYCEELMRYVTSFDGFESKHENEEGIAANVFAYTRTPGSVFWLLQDRGLANWQTAKKHRILRPIAWLYQANRYFFKGIKMDHAKQRLKKEYQEAQKRKMLFDYLGIQQAAKGLSKLEDGKYVIRNKRT